MENFPPMLDMPTEQEDLRRIRRIILSNLNAYWWQCSLFDDPELGCPLSDDAKTHAVRDFNTLNNYSRHCTFKPSETVSIGTDETMFVANISLSEAKLLHEIRVYLNSSKDATFISERTGPIREMIGVMLLREFMLNSFDPSQSPDEVTYRIDATGLCSDIAQSILQSSDVLTANKLLTKRPDISICDYSKKTTMYQSVDYSIVMASLPEKDRAEFEEMLNNCIGDTRDKIPDISRPTLNLIFAPEDGFYARMTDLEYKLISKMYDLKTQQCRCSSGRLEAINYCMNL